MGISDFEQNEGAGERWEGDALLSTTFKIKGKWTVCITYQKSTTSLKTKDIKSQNQSSANYAIYQKLHYFIYFYLRQEL